MISHSRVWRCLWNICMSISEEFKLLVNGSYGTKFQNFVEHLVDIETEYTYKFMEATGLHFKGGK